MGLRIPLSLSASLEVSAGSDTCAPAWETEAQDMMGTDLGDKGLCFACL